MMDCLSPGRDAPGVTLGSLQRRLGVRQAWSHGGVRLAAGIQVDERELMGAWVGYFTGSLADDAARTAEVATSLESWSAAIVAELGDGLLRWRDGAGNKLFRMIRKRAAGG